MNSLAACNLTNTLRLLLATLATGKKNDQGIPKLIIITVLA
jgi:hypothetical protein